MCSHARITFIRSKGTRGRCCVAVGSAIDEELQKVKAQRDGLKRRLDDLIARAAIVGGNDLEDCLIRAEAYAKLLAARWRDRARPGAVEDAASIFPISGF